MQTGPDQVRVREDISVAELDALVIGEQVPVALRVAEQSCADVLVTPPASASTPLWQLAARHAPAVPPLIIHSDGGPLSRATSFMLAPTHATAVVLRDYTSALWTDTLADRADEIAAALLAHVAEAHARSNLDARLVIANRGYARVGRSGSVFRTSPPSELVTQAAHTGSCLAARLRVYTRNAPVGPEPSEAEAQEEPTTQIVAD